MKRIDECTKVGYLLCESSERGGSESMASAVIPYNYIAIPFYSKCVRTCIFSYSVTNDKGIFAFGVRHVVFADDCLVC